MICTFAKLEKWVSTPGIGEKLISDLERKLGNDGMEDLENGLKDKEPKNVLCFNAHNIDEIRKNKELAKFLSTTEATTVPKLTYSMFFKKGGSGSSENKNQSFSDVEEITDMNADVSSSGYESVLSSTLNDGDEDNMTSGNEDKRSESKTTEQLHGQLVVPMDYEVKANGPSQEPMDMQDTDIDKERCQKFNIVVNKEMTMPNKQKNNKVTPLENGFASMEMQNTHIDQMNEELQKSNVPNFPRHEVYLCPNDRITKTEKPLADEPESTVMKYKHINETNDEPKRSSVPIDENVLQISSTKASLKDEKGSTDVQVADTDGTNEKTQRLHFLNAQRNEDLFMDKNEKSQKIEKDVIMHQNELTTKIRTPLEDRFGRTVLQDAHIDGTHDKPKMSNVPINKDVLLYKNEQIIKEGKQQQDRLGKINMKDTPIGELDEKPEKSNVPINKNVLLDKNEQITSKEALLEDGFKSTDMQDSDTDETNDESRRAKGPHAPTFKSIYLGQNESITKTKTPLEDKHRNIAMQDTHTDETNAEPKRSSVPRNEDKLLYENKQIKEAPLEDRYESMDVQDADIEDINDEPQRSNVFDVLPHGSIYLCQNEPITKMETQLENKSPTTDTKEIEEINVQSQRSNALVHESVTMHLNESHQKNKKTLEDKLRSTVMQATQNYEINDEQKRSSIPRNEEVLYQNELITNKDAPLEDEIENINVQDADIEDMYDEPQRSNVPDVLTQRNIYLHHNNLTTKIETPIEDELRTTFMKYKHINETNDGPKNSIVSRNEDVLLYQNEQIISKEPTLEDEFEKTDMQNADNDQINMKPQSHDNVSLNKNVKFPIKETSLENTRSNVPIDDLLLYQNKQITRKQAPLEVELESMDVQDVDIDDISEKPQIVCLTNDDVLLNQNEQINDKEAPLEDEHERPEKLLGRAEEESVQERAL
ncbi:uncharacterized protein LOC128514912 [Clarias gariepinus]|uniref:uncharacterized protein LOC128514912 n=1 Tax=Clarias gariepinus TaxID=13013 RepID=UPI00234CE0D6|nr:uncharacterized protein LOC128514912 [Clarias gariepinus]